MRKFIRNIFLLYLFWFTLFFSGRIAFILYQFNFHFPSDFYNILFSGWKLDWSAASYLIFIPAVLLCINLFSIAAVIRKTFFVYHYLIIPFIVILTLANIVVYKSWNTLINSKALLYALQPVEMFASLTNKQIFFNLLSLFLFCFAFILFFKKLIQWKNFNEADSKIFKTVFPIAFIAFLAIGIRGGLQEIPVNESAAVFSINQMHNDIATNNIWFLGSSIEKSGFENQNLYAELNDDDAIKIVKQLYDYESSTTRIILKNNRPNIVILLLESWTRDVIEPMDGLKNITPYFTSLTDSGLLFTNIYATGRRTDQALPSVISGFPSQPDRSIIRYIDKAKKLPFITRLMIGKGYSNSFYYGGDLSFNNMHTFLLNAGFQNIIGKERFASSAGNSKWGAHDEFVLMQQAKDMNRQKEPFFSVLLTLTSHEPFEIPTELKFPGTNDSALFINSVYYSDECLKKYFAYARQQPWYANTLFVLMADHGHLLPLNREYYDPKSRLIPLLFYGEVLKPEYRGKKDSTIGNQNDITVTLLNQLNIDSKQFVWSKDLFNPDVKHFAYINADKYFCWMWNQGYYRYNSESRKIETDAFLVNPVKDEITKGIAYRQKLLDQFIAY